MHILQICRWSSSSCRSRTTSPPRWPFNNHSQICKTSHWSNRLQLRRRQGCIVNTCYRCQFRKRKIPRKHAVLMISLCDILFLLIRAWELHRLFLHFFFAIACFALYVSFSSPHYFVFSSSWLKSFAFIEFKSLISQMSSNCVVALYIMPTRPSKTPTSLPCFAARISSLTHGMCFQSCHNTNM